MPSINGVSGQSFSGNLCKIIPLLIPPPIKINNIYIYIKLLLLYFYYIYYNFYTISINYISL